MAKICIVVFTHKAKERVGLKKKGAKSTGFDGMKYYGLKYVVSEIDKSHSIEYCAPEYIDNYDFALVSITSYYDYMNIIKSMPRKRNRCKVIVGGAGFLSVNSIIDYIDIGVFGRAEGIINDVIDGSNVDGVWRKIIDPLCAGLYIVRPPQKLIKIEGLIETSVGCKRKCSFCQYGWRSKFYEESGNNDYSSGFNDNEDMLYSLDWSKTSGYLVSAIDGFTEQARSTVGKSMSTDDILKKMAERNDIDRDIKQLKLYNIWGFPFENMREYKSDVVELFRLIASVLKKRTNIILNNTHFVPMPMTPMESEPINFGTLKNTDFMPINNGNLKVFSLTRETSPATAAEQAIINRISYEDRWKIKSIIMTSKYKSMGGSLKSMMLKKHFAKYVVEFESPIPHIKRIDGLDKAKTAYHNRKKINY